MDSFKPVFAGGRGKRPFHFKVSILVLLLVLIEFSCVNAFTPHLSSRCHLGTFHDQPLMKQPSLGCSSSSSSSSTTISSLAGRRVSCTDSALAASNLPDFSTTNGDGSSKEQDERGRKGEISWGEQASKFIEMARPYYNESKSGRWLFVGMIALTLMNSGVSVAFSYIGKDFWNALSAKDQTLFYQQLVKYAAALLVGAPVKVLYS